MSRRYRLPSERSNTDPMDVLGAIGKIAVGVFAAAAALLAVKHMETYNIETARRATEASQRIDRVLGTVRPTAEAPVIRTFSARDYNNTSWDYAIVYGPYYDRVSLAPLGNGLAPLNERSVTSPQSATQECLYANIYKLDPARENDPLSMNNGQLVAAAHVAASETGRPEPYLMLENGQRAQPIATRHLCGPLRPLAAPTAG